MKYLEFYNSFKDFAVFSLADINLLYPDFDRRRLHEWQKKGYIKKIIRGFYYFNNINIDENFRYEAANRIYEPSYVSLESALAYYGLIPETVFSVTSLSTKKTVNFSSSLGSFIYRRVKPELFWGYIILKNQNRPIKIAEPEKAILDYLYLHSGIRQDTDILSLRINPESFRQVIREDVLESCSLKFSNFSLIKRLKLLLKVIKNA